MGKDTSRAAKHHTNLDPLSVSCHALSSTLAWCKRLREHKGTMWTQFIWLTGYMPERRHHAATLKVKTLQSARQPAMQRLLNKWSRISPPPTVRLSDAAGMPDACNTDLQQLPYPGTANKWSWKFLHPRNAISPCYPSWRLHEVRLPTRSRFYHMIWIDLVASCLESDGNPMEISWNFSLLWMTSKHRSSLCGSHTETASKMLQGVHLVPKQHVIGKSTCLKSSQWQWCHTSPFRAPFLPLPVRTSLK